MHILDVLSADVLWKMPCAGDIRNDCAVRLQSFGQALRAERIRRRTICAAGDLNSLVRSAHITHFLHDVLSAAGDLPQSRSSFPACQQHEAAAIQLHCTNSQTTYPFPDRKPPNIPSSADILHPRERCPPLFCHCKCSRRAGYP